jgi:hypothetical protein
MSIVSKRYFTGTGTEQKKRSEMFRSWLLFPKSSGRGNTRFVFGSGRVYSDYPSDSSFLKSTLFSGLSSAFS